ncbi:hypothetical protein MAIT1_00732 [Magnetofaba australis IT-1]|uniref:Uncharacterized protein n=1 Tax=Magnetofaba australis IT-1 TaxID=1434232 RepID=A0A1Y2JZD5_9PROT|nr:hypothetical protein MAIT1_00732 [Magnetofaba australis IT-1]
MNEFANTSKELYITMRITEIGQDHWNLYTFTSLKPTDGFTFHINMKDEELAIKKHDVFVTTKKEMLDICVEKDEMRVECSQWVDGGAGLAVLIADKETGGMEINGDSIMPCNFPKPPGNSGDTHSHSN